MVFFTEVINTHLKIVLSRLSQTMEKERKDQTKTEDAITEWYATHSLTLS
jgi:hypothetical protein